MVRPYTTVTVLAGLVLLVGAPALWSLTRPSPDTGDAGALPVPATAATTPTPEPSPAPTPAPSPDGPRVAAAPTATPPAASAASAAPPVQVRIGAIGLDATIVGVGVAADGQLAVPDDVSVVGWYRFGSAPGQPGATVLAGHVDARTQGPGAFRRLAALEAGDRVEIRTGDGAWQAFTVSARRTYAKQAVPLGALFTRQGPSHLLLITCGGAFDPATRRYADNVVVAAAPLPDPPSAPTP